MNHKINILLTAISIKLMLISNIVAQPVADTGTTIRYEVNVLDYNDCACNQIPTQVSVSKLGLMFNHDMGPNTIITHSLSYKHQDFGLKGFFENRNNEGTVLHGHIYAYSVSGRYLINENWTAYSYFKPIVKSYLEESNRQYYGEFEGGVLFKFRKSANWTFGGGYAYSRNLSEGLIHPLLLIEFNNHRNFKAVMYFPHVAEMWYSLGNRWEFGLTAKLDGDEFIGKDATYNHKKTSVQYADLTIGPEISGRISNSVRINLRTAYTAGRHLVFESEDARQKVQISPVWGLSAGIQIQL